MKPRSILQFVLRGGAPLYIVRMDRCMATELMKFGFVKEMVQLKDLMVISMNIIDLMLVRKIF